MPQAKQLLACVITLCACRGSAGNDRRAAVESASPDGTRPVPAPTRAREAVLEGAPAPSEGTPAPSELPSAPAAEPPPAQAQPALPAAASAAAGELAVFPANWCSRAPADLDERFDFIADISDSYYAKQSRNCLTRGLTQFAKDEVLGPAWLDYLFGYTNAMIGC